MGGVRATAPIHDILSCEFRRLQRWGTCVIAGDFARPRIPQRPLRGGQFMQAMLPGGKQIIRANARDENEN
jgi:hypothetical protein